MRLAVTAVMLFGCLVGGTATKVARPQTNATVESNTVAPANEIEAARTQLREKIRIAGTFAEEKYSIDSWMEMRMDMSEGRRVADEEGSSLGRLRAVSADLQEKIVALQARKVLPDLAPRLGLSASVFATNRNGPVNNVALQWAASDSQDSFEIHRATGKSNDFTKIYSGRGASFNDTSLKSGTYSYKMVAYKSGKELTSNIEQIRTMALPAGIQEYSNQTGVGISLNEPLKIGKTYYRFPSERDGKALKAMWVETSRDGKNWVRGAVVMDRDSDPGLLDYKFEAVNFFYDDKHDQIVMWAHWERAQGYGSGRAIVATAKPGGRFTVHHIYNPLGVEVRDMSVFIDGDGQGYLIAASNLPGQGANATLYLFKLNDYYTDVTGIANKFMEGGYREAPHIIKIRGFYYLFFSQAAGWYPSRAGYMSATSINGRWSDVRPLANNSTFSAQSGGIFDFGHGKAYLPVMQANRWIRGEGTSSNVMLPLHPSAGFVFGDYAPTLLVDSSKDLIVPLYAGTLLSQNQPASASLPGNPDHEAAKAFDGDYSTSFQSDEKKWPFSVTSDLGTVSKVENVQISWNIAKGSEAYYKYTLEGSLDGQEWRLLLDRTNDKDTFVSKTYGFSSDMLPESPSVRYLRVNVQGAVLHNNPNNWYPPMLYEVKVFGEKG